eukprot:Em0001g760a
MEAIAFQASKLPTSTGSQVPTVPISIGPDFNILGVLQSFPKGSAAGPSGLRIQHLLDAASIPLPTSICSSLRDLVNLLSSGKAPTSVSTFLAGGSLTALNKFKPGCLPDVRPIAVGEALRRLTEKCLCSLIKQVILDECALHFPELLPWATWCYAAHPLLWHPMGRIFSETGVQQGDPLGPLLFALVLQKILNAIDADDDCIHILYQAWYLDDGTLAGKKSAILRALSLLDSIGPSLGIFINMSKCELFCKGDTSEFPPSMKSSHVPHLDLLGAPIGDYLFCGKYAASKRSEALKLLSRLVEVGASDPQVALILLHLCGSYCKLIHLARATPPSLVSEALQLFDAEVRQCFAQSIAVEVTDRAWQQAQLNLSHGGLGLRSVSHHSSAAYIASLCASGFGDAQNPHLSHTVDLFNKLVSPSEVISVDAITTSPVQQRVLSKKLEDHQFSLLLEASSPADKAQLLSVSAPHAASWLLTALDRLGNHATTCKQGGDVVTRHNHLRNVIVEFCHRAHLGVRVESGSGITPDLSRTRPADVLVLNWERGKHAVLDITVTSPLIPSILTAASLSEGAAVEEAEVRKHRANDPKCSELGWVCIPLAVETYGNWGREAQSTFSRLASHLAIITSSHKSKVLTELYSRLNFTLVQAVARALLIYDDELRATVCSSFNIQLAESDPSWTQSTLPVRHGGLGFRSAVQLAHSAFLASAAASSGLAHLILPANMQPPQLSYVDEALAAWSQGCQEQPPTDAAAHHQKTWDTIRRPVQLNALPVTSLGLRMDNATMRISMGLCLGLPLCQSHNCQHCGAEVSQFATHGLSCRKSAGRHHRHSAVKEIIHRALVSAHIPSRLEPSGLYRSDGKRPDGVSIVPWECGQLLVWDATCPDTFAPSYSTIAAHQVGAVTQQAEDRKMQKYKHLDSCYFFTPVAIETSGVFGPKIKEFLKELGFRLRQVSGEANSFAYLTQRLSVAIQRGNAASVLGTIKMDSEEEEFLV